MASGLIDSYIKLLSGLDGAPFQQAIEDRLLVALNGFQTVPDKPHGDGGVDGLAHKGRHAFCCYGVQYDPAKTSAQRTKQIVDKFSDDLLRIFELERVAKALIHKENTALLSVRGSIPAASERIEHISLIVNWFESHAIIGGIVKHIKVCSAKSQCRWVQPDVEFVIRGPREFAAEYGVDESTMVWLEHREVFVEIDQQALSIDVPEGPTFDAKMTAAEGLLPGSENAVRDSAGLMRMEWQRAIAFERILNDRLPARAYALERARQQLGLRVLRQQGPDPWAVIERAQETAEAVLRPDFATVYGETFVKERASGEVARLVGVCPINWRAAKKPVV